MERELNLRYFKNFKEFWVPILKKQVFNAIATNNTNALISIRDNIFKNWNLTKEQKEYVFYKIGVYKIKKY